MFSLIAAVGKNRELGRGGELVFHIRDDMKFFRETTRGHKVVMGRKTWDSLSGKLPGRENLVISRREFEGPDEIIHDVKSFIDEWMDSEEEVFVIGGGTIYAMFLPYARNLYLTEIDEMVFDADTFFPEFDSSKYEKNIIKKGRENDLAFSIVKYSKDN